LTSQIEVEVLGSAADAPSEEEIRRLCEVAASSAAIDSGHLAIEFVGSERIAELNARYRGKPAPTDVLSFPIDELDQQEGVERELGDVVICPEHTADLREAIVHGVLHLLGMDHETDDGEMLELQAQILAGTPAGGQA
jgi:probable rRNA maturation factor